MKYNLKINRRINLYCSTPPHYHSMINLVEFHSGQTKSGVSFSNQCVTRIILRNGGVYTFDPLNILYYRHLEYQYVTTALPNDIRNHSAVGIV